MERLIPFSDQFPFNKENFRFLGEPIDGISFEEDGIYFIEFKTGQSQESVKQRRIKEQVKNKEVYWMKIHD